VLLQRRTTWTSINVPQLTPQCARLNPHTHVCVMTRPVSRLSSNVDVMGTLTWPAPARPPDRVHSISARPLSSIAMRVITCSVNQCRQEELMCAAADEKEGWRGLPRETSRG
jgi:hypothetical protein